MTHELVQRMWGPESWLPVAAREGQLWVIRSKPNGQGASIEP